MSKLAPLFTWRSALAESGLPPVTRHVALALSLYMNERGGSAHPGPALLAKDTGLHISTVKEKLAELEGEGWLRCIHRGGLRGERRHANEYETATPVALGYPSPPPTGTQEVPVAEPDPSDSARRPVAVGDPISPESSPSNTRGGDFDAWWEPWPRKRDRAEAKAKYRARRRQGASHADLCRARDNYLATITDPQFCKYGGTFLGPETWREWLNPVADTNGHRPKVYDPDALSRSRE